MGKLLMHCTLTRSPTDRWARARGFFRDCEGSQNCGNQTISRRKGRQPCWMTTMRLVYMNTHHLADWKGESPTPGFKQLLTHCHLSLRRLIGQFASIWGRACAHSHQAEMSRWSPTDQNIDIWNVHTRKYIREQNGSYWLIYKQCMCKYILSI